MVNVSDELAAVPSSGWYTAEVAGESMVPTLRPGDLLVVRAQRRVSGYAVGQLALVHFEARPGRVMVKRVRQVHPDGLWVTGDNPGGSDASERFGLAQPLGRVVGRVWPRPGLLRGPRHVRSPRAQ